MYNYFQRNMVSNNVLSNSINASIAKKRKKSSGSSSSNVRRRSLPRRAKNRLEQFQAVLDERARQESQQQVL